MPTEKLLAIQMEPGLSASVTVATAEGTRSAVESQYCYFVYGDPGIVRCNFSLKFVLPVPLVDPEPVVWPPENSNGVPIIENPPPGSVPDVPAVAPPVLYGAMAGVLLLALLGRRRTRKARLGAS